MFTRCILLVVVATMFVVQGQMAPTDGTGAGANVIGDGPEKMQSPVVRILEENVGKQMNAAFAYYQMVIKHAVYLARDNKTATLLQQVIGYKYKNARRLIMYAGSRGETFNPHPPSPIDLSQCDKLSRCWEVSLSIERDLYRSLSSLFTTARNYEDIEMEQIAVSLVQDEMRSIREVKNSI